jgi:3D (Asp-Asp-Asp) domain-containing protein
MAEKIPKDLKASVILVLLIVITTVATINLAQVTGVYFERDMLRQQVVELQQDNDEAKALLSQVFKRKVTDLTTFTTSVTITAYTAREEECDATPEITADGTPSRVGVVAMSQDMFRKHNLTFGDRVMLMVDGENLGVFEIRDTMNQRWTDRIDILHGNLKAARLFGKTKGEIMWVQGARV